MTALEMPAELLQAALVQQEAEECACEMIMVDPLDGEEMYHYLRICPATGEWWWSLHCAHDGVQNPCRSCGELHPEGTRRPLEFPRGMKSGWELEMYG